MQNNDNLIFILIIGLCGLFSVLGSIFNWDFFFKNKKATTFVRFLGRNGARVFYAILGVVLLLIAFKIAYE